MICYFGKLWWSTEDCFVMLWCDTEVDVALLRLKIFFLLRVGIQKKKGIDFNFYI